MDADKTPEAQSLGYVPNALQQLRQQADAKISPADIHIDDMSDLELKNLIYELQVHQLELSIQNEELRETQLNLAETRDQYLALYDRAPVAYLTLGDSGRIGACNLATSHLLGVPRTALLNRRLQEFVSQEFQNDFHFYWQHLLDSRESQVVELAVKSSQSITWVRLECQRATPDDGGAESRWYAAMTDISEQKQLQQNLARLNQELEQRVAIRTRKYEESRQELDAILNAVADAVITFDDSGNIEHVNRAAERLLEYAVGEIIGLNIRQLIPKSGIERHIDFFQQFPGDKFAEVNAVSAGEIYACTKSGTLIPATISVARVDNQEKFTAVLRDIREIKSLQREVLKTTEIERSRISRELHDSLGQELVGLSMLAKSMAAETFADHRLEAETAEYFTRISRMLDGCVVELRQIIFDLAPLSLTDGGLEDALRNLVNMVNKSAGVECRLTCDGVKNSVDAETDIQLLRIAREAVHNAVKHAHARHIDICLKADKEIRLEVADDGIGMPENGVVDPKSQGIRIMHYRANVMGGKLLVEPNSPSGTRVIFLLARGI